MQNNNMKYSLFFLTIKNVKTILSLQATQKQAENLIFLVHWFSNYPSVGDSSIQMIMYRQQKRAGLH